jgi:glycerophosphoryl diester phosphodiesterase
VIFDGKPSVVGHRGFGAGEPDGYRENSLESVLAAARSGLGWVELDVQRSADAKLVVRHDPVTPAGQPVVSRTAAELAAIGILTLDEVLAELPATVGVDLDVKTIVQDAIDPPGQRTPVLLADALRRHRKTRALLITSFDPSVLTYLTEQQGRRELALGLLTGPGFPVQHGIPAAANLGLDALCPHAGSLAEPQAIDIAHRAGLEVLAWVPSPAEAVALAQAGADAVCADDVPGALAGLKQAGLGPAD